MTARLGNNVVTFTPTDESGQAAVGTDEQPIRVALLMETAIVQKPGVKPDVWTARVPYTEFDKLGLEREVRDGETPPSTRGYVALWYNGLPGVATTAGPDVVIEQVSLVDVQATAYGRTPINRDRVVEYRLSLCDFRDQYVEPRGGRLRLGLVNPTPKGKADDQGDNPVEGITLTLSQMILACLTAMGVADRHLPAGIDSTPAPPDARWFGNHAPGELEKLLKLCNCVACPKRDGRLVIETIGKGDGPQYPPAEALPVYAVPSIDRRGKTVIFSSYPSRVWVTESLDGPSDDTWQFVVQDADNVWRTHAKSTLLAGTKLSDHFRAGLANIPAQFRSRVKNEAYRHLRLSFTRHSPSLSPVLAKMIEGAGQAAKFEQTPVVVTASIAEQDQATGLYRNTGAKTDTPAHLLSTSDSRLMVAVALVQVTEPTKEPWRDLKELASGDLTVRFSYERAHQDPQDPKKWLPDYFHAGWRRDIGGQLKKLTDDEVENALDGHDRDAVILTDPTIRLLVSDGQEANRTEIEDRLRGLADQYLATSGTPAGTHACRGFAAVDVSGQVSEVRWEQDKLITVAITAGWWAPAGALTDGGVIRKLEEEEAYPNQKATEAGKGALGESGANHRAYPMGSGDTPGVAASSLYLVNLIQDGGQDGDSSTDPGTGCTWTYKAIDRDTGQQIAANLTPLKGRLFSTSMTKATKGVGQQTAAGFVLWDTDEVSSSQTKCS